MDLNAGGLRVVIVLDEVLTDLLQGRAMPATPENVPADMRVIGSISKDELIRVTGGRIVAHPSGKVALLCQSKEWAKGEDIDRATNDIRIFEPCYRRKEDRCRPA